MARIYLARHGETEWNARGKLQGHTDVPLNAAGQRQASALAEKLRGRGVSAVVASDLSRARQTAEVVAAALQVALWEVDADLRERRFGVFEGLTYDECKATHPGAWQAWVERATAPPGGEDREIVVARMTRALARAAARATHGAIVVVSHGGVMRLWLHESLQASVPRIGNGAVYEIDRSEGPEGGFHAALLP